MKIILSLLIVNVVIVNYFLVDNMPPANHPGKALAANCFQCHGTNMCGLEGLAGESANEIEEEMRELSKKNPREEIMNVHAMAYTDEEIAQMADYISQLTCSTPITSDYRSVDGKRLDTDDDHSKSHRFMGDQYLESEAQITGDTYIEYEAGTEVELFPNFSAEKGSVFEVEIHHCNQ